MSAIVMIFKVLFSTAKVKFHCDCLFIPWFVFFQFSPVCLVHIMDLDTSIYFRSPAHLLQPDYMLVKMLPGASGEKARPKRSGIPCVGGGSGNWACLVRKERRKDAWSCFQTPKGRPKGKSVETERGCFVELHREAL